jgi:hypothetical protein
MIKTTITLLLLAGLLSVSSFAVSHEPASSGATGTQSAAPPRGSFTPPGTHLSNSTGSSSSNVRNDSGTAADGRSTMGIGTGISSGFGAGGGTGGAGGGTGGAGGGTGR